MVYISTNLRGPYRQVQSPKLSYEWNEPETHYELVPNGKQLNLNYSIFTYGLSDLSILKSLKSKDGDL